jgi:hypothetical protein
MKLSKKSLELLATLFGEGSQLQIPVGLIDNVIEIRNAVKEEIEQTKEE